MGSRLRAVLGEPERARLGRQTVTRSLQRLGHGACVNCWARSYFVSTVGRDEGVIREYLRNQREEDNLWDPRDGS
jgi:REP element-mobilizing transposase RayT